MCGSLLLYKRWGCECGYYFTVANISPLLLLLQSFFPAVSKLLERFLINLSVAQGEGQMAMKIVNTPSIVVIVFLMCFVLVASAATPVAGGPVSVATTW